MGSDTYYTKDTAKAARLAVQGVLLAIDKVVTGDWRSAFAFVRPPGHHADMEGEPCGFCTYSNVAIGTKYALQKYPQIKKVLIYDWDVHHGNSTYKYLCDHPDVLFMSLHRYDGGYFYPG